MRIEHIEIDLEAAVMPKNLDKLSDAELAAWHYAHRAELDGAAGDVVDAEITPEFSVTMSFRLPGREADAIRESALRAEMTLSEWIRQACADAFDAEPGGGTRQRMDVMLTIALEHVDFLDRRLKAIQKTNRRLATGTSTSAASAAKKPATKARTGKRGAVDRS